MQPIITGNIVCGRTKEIDYSSVVSGTTIDNCNECNEDVYMSPASKTLQLDYEVKILCNQCAAPKIKEMLDSGKYPVVEIRLSEFQTLTELNLLWTLDQTYGKDVQVVIIND